VECSNKGCKHQGRIIGELQSELVGDQIEPASPERVSCRRQIMSAMTAAFLGSGRRDSTPRASASVNRYQITSLAGGVGNCFNCSRQRWRPWRVLRANCCHYLPLSDAQVLGVTFNLELPAGRAEVPCVLKGGVSAFGGRSLKIPSQSICGVPPRGWRTLKERSPSCDQSSSPRPQP
jgi:hypothetical protein